MSETQFRVVHLGNGNVFREIREKKFFFVSQNTNFLIKIVGCEQYQGNEDTSTSRIVLKHMKMKMVTINNSYLVNYTYFI